MDLTGRDIDAEYLKIIQDNKQWLASWVFRFVKTAEDKLFRKDDSERIHLPEWYERPFFNNINSHIDDIRKKCRDYTHLSPKDIVNVGLLSYFWSKYLEIFSASIQLPNDTEFVYKGKCEKHNRKELIKDITNGGAESLIMLHDTDSPQAAKTVVIDTDLNDPVKAKQIRKKGEQYAKDIISYYQSYGVSINIQSSAEYKDERYVFLVKMMPGTNRMSIGRYADEVRRLLDIEFFYPDITSSSIKLIASEKPLKENSLLKILESQKFKDSKAEIPYAVGYDMMGEIVIADVAEFPHLLIGGTTNSGKSSAIHSLLMSIVSKQPAGKVKVLLLDFGSSRLNMFANIPHMLLPSRIISDIIEGQWCILKLHEIMEQRLISLMLLDARNYDNELKKWPYIVCVIDEFPAFIQRLTGGKDNSKVSAVIEDILARARKVKIHLILSAQDATKGSMGIKNTNLGAGIAFRCISWQNSKAIIGEVDATNLYGKGSMYFKCNQHEGLRRLQGAYMSPEEIMDTLTAMDFSGSNIKGKYDEVGFEIGASKEDTQSETALTAYVSEGGEDDGKQLLVEIVEWICNDKRENISNNQLKDNFQMGYVRANRFIRLLEEAEIISKQRKGAKLPRVVNLDKAEVFLRGHGCLGTNEEDDSPQIQDGADAEPEPIPEENMDTTVEPVEIQEAKDDNLVDITPQPERKKKIKLNMDALKSDCRKFRKRPVH